MLFGKTIVAALALAGAMLLPGVAMARDAYTTGNVNIRTGPGTNYGRIGTLPAGTPIDVRNCSGNWCNVYGDRLRGWISANYIAYDRPSYRPPVVVVPPPIYVRPPHYRPPYHRPPHFRPPPRPPHPPRPPRPPRPGGPAGANCKIGGGLPCPR